ncbi:MAG: thiamine pyrophosphate-dependent enzyme [Thermodesulfobacteriota bacterium]|nr:thiamine pyrophosphate-dependent enzyme [Thermodesulfobacteriota bacterium]
MPTKEALTGNQAVAVGVKLSRVKVITAYPITPQTTIVEELADMIAAGELDAEYIPSEGEHGMVGEAIGAALTGVRTFTSTCGQGFLFGYENIAWIPGVRLPVVMAVTNRSTAMPLDMYCDHSDAMSARDQGWIQLYVENAQESLDTIIQAYRLGEDRRVLFPVMVCLDGFFVSHTTEMVSIPDQKKVDKFLPPYEQKHIILDPNRPMEIVGILPPEKGMAYEYLKSSDLGKALAVIKEVNQEFGKKFSRYYGNGLVEKIHCDDAEVAVITLGSMTGNGRIAVEELRREGKKAGLIRIRTFRPFPKDEIRALAKDLKVLAVIDRNLSKGLNEGALFTEIKSILYPLEKKPRVLGFIAGLHGVEIFTSDVKYMAEKALAVAQGTKIDEEVEWVPKFDLLIQEVKPVKQERMYYPGTTTCPGCAIALIFRRGLDIIGRDIIALRTAGCQAWQSSIPGKTLLNIPLGRSVLPGGAACATGVFRGLRAKGKDKTPVVLFGGDGSIGDMGFLALSGAAERNENMITILYDNEAYANTGLQRSGTTPQWAWTSTTPVGPAWRGKIHPKKDLPMIMAAHQVPYVATGSVAHIKDYEKKVKKALGIKGFRYIHVLSPCPASWRYSSENTIELGRLAVQTGMWVLYEIEDGNFKLSVKPNKLKPVKEYLKAQGRFSHLTDEELASIQEEVNRRWEQMLAWGKKGEVTL